MHPTHIRRINQISLYELCLPATTDAADNDSAIIIDPLTILPVARAHKKEKGMLYIIIAVLSSTSLYKF